MVGNKERTQCYSLSPDVFISIQKHSFTIPFYLLPIKGVDVFLGMDWLHFLGPLQAGFSTPSTFHHGYPITSHGTTKLSPNHVSYTHICHLLHIDVIASLHLLTFQHIPSSTPSITQNHHPYILTLLKTYHLVFPSLVDYHLIDHKITTFLSFHNLHQSI